VTRPTAGAVRYLPSLMRYKPASTPFWCFPACGAPCPTLRLAPQRRPRPEDGRARSSSSVALTVYPSSSTPLSSTINFSGGYGTRRSPLLVPGFESFHQLSAMPLAGPRAGEMGGSIAYSMVRGGRVICRRVQDASGPSARSRFQRSSQSAFEVNRREAGRPVSKIGEIRLSSFAPRSQHRARVVRRELEPSFPRAGRPLATARRGRVRCAVRRPDCFGESQRDLCHACPAHGNSVRGRLCRLIVTPSSGSMRAASIA
jgi:hypothetical protein